MLRVAAAVRNWAYDVGLRPRKRLPVAVVSVGNLTAGGTGKTPFVAWLARSALAAGRRPAILSRGYGPKPPGSALSDEGTVLAEVLEGRVPQVEDPDRVRGGEALLAAHPDVDWILLDDGFQHRRVARDVDVVLLDATDPFSSGRFLPLGRLREPPESLARAHAVVVTRRERVDAATVVAILATVRSHAPKAVLAVARTRPRVLLAPGGGERPLAALRNAAVFAYAGIGNPAQFEGTLADLGARVLGRRWARDHHAPARGEPERLAAEARAAGADLVVTTRKDWVKWRGLPGLPEGFLALDVETEVVEGAEPLLRLALAASVS